MLLPCRLQGVQYNQLTVPTLNLLRDLGRQPNEKLRVPKGITSALLMTRDKSFEGRWRNLGYSMLSGLVTKLRYYEATHLGESSPYHLPVEQDERTKNMST